MNEEQLAARYYLYALFQGLFGSDPESGAFGDFDVELYREACEIVGIESGRLADMLEDASHSCAEELVDLHRAYVHTLVGPGKLPASPWESTHVSGEDALFQISTLNVRNAYRSQGFLPQGYPNVADDHVSLECAFLAALASRALQGEVAAKDVDLSRALRASREFLEAHPLAWVGAYASGLVTDTRSGLYAAAADRLFALMQTDALALAAAGY